MRLRQSVGDELKSQRAAQADCGGKAEVYRWREVGTGRDGYPAARWTNQSSHR
jgi:hypothetical protein